MSGKDDIFIKSNAACQSWQRLGQHPDPSRRRWGVGECASAPMMVMMRGGGTSGGGRVGRPSEGMHHLPTSSPSALPPTSRAGLEYVPRLPHQI